MAVPSHAAPLSSTTSSLLLAQAVNELGTGDWNAVASRLTGSDLLDDEEDQVTPQTCETAFVELLAAEGPGSPTAPNARSIRKLIHKLYADALKEQYDAVIYSFTQEKHLLTVIDSLSAATTPDAALLEALPTELRARVDAAAAEVDDGPATSTRGRKSPRKAAKAEPDTEQLEEEGEGDDTSGAEEEVRESLRGSSRQKERMVKAEPTSEAESEVEEGRSTRRGRSRPIAGATSSPRKSSRARRGATEEEGTPAEDEGTPAEGEEDDEGEGEEEGEEGRRGGRRRGAPPVAGTRAKRASKRRLTSEPFSPPSSVAGDGERPSGRQAKRIKTEGEVLAADGARFRKSILLLLSRLDDLPSSSLFRHPVRRGDAPSYSTAVKRPMWLAQITSRVKKGLTRDAEELMRDVALLCADAVQFNGTEDDVGQKARELWGVFEGMMEEYLSRNQQED